MAIYPGFQSQGTDLDCFTSCYLFLSSGRQTGKELRLQPLNPTQH